MEGTHTLLAGLGFRYVTADNLSPSETALLQALGTGRGCFVRTCVLGLGATLARDAKGRLYVAKGQFDLSFWDFHETIPRYQH